MRTLNISLPDAMAQFVEEQVAAREYANVSEYFHDLVRGDLKRLAKEQLESTVLQALNSDNDLELSPDWWAGLRVEAKRKT